MIEQKVLNFDIKTNYDNDVFFVSKSNYIAHKALITNNIKERFIYLKGPKKSGKTHLGRMWKKINNAIEYEINDNIKILKQENNIFCDNFFSFINEEYFFHLINHCYNNNLKILITGEIFPSDYKFKINDLSSRIKSFNILEIMDPDDELLKNLLMKLLYDKQIIIKNEEIFSYITKRINRTFVDIYNFVESIDKLSLSKKREITIPLIKELL